MTRLGRHWRVKARCARLGHPIIHFSGSTFWLLRVTAALLLQARRKRAGEEEAPFLRKVTVANGSELAEPAWSGLSCIWAPYTCVKGTHHYSRYAPRWWTN